MRINGGNLGKRVALTNSYRAAGELAGLITPSSVKNARSRFAPLTRRRGAGQVDDGFMAAHPIIGWSDPNGKIRSDAASKCPSLS